MSYCSPNIIPEDNYSCFSIFELKEIATAYNIYNQKQNTFNKGNNPLIDISQNDKKYLWTQIYNKLSDKCTLEFCWIEQDFINKIKNKELKNKLKYFTFKPKISKKKNQWMDTDKINETMKQYEKFDSTFLFLGAQPSDFYKLIKVDYNNFKIFSKIGIVFNLDNHTQDGSHWVALLIDNQKQSIEYFDSVGKKPNKNISTFIHILQKKFPKFKLTINNIQHQSKNNACGIYAMHFLIQRILGYTFNEISDTIVHDDEMNLYRNILFRPRE